MTEINTKAFCIEVTEKCNSKGVNVIKEQIMLALGGISNLYLTACIKKNVPSLNVLTKHSFVSPYVGIESILNEIGNCTGVGRHRSEVIFDQMNCVFYDKIVSNNRINMDSKIQFNPIGTFKYKSLEQMIFQLDYKDPAADHYSSFLFDI